VLQLWLARLLFTQLVEIPIYSYALRGRALVAFGASAITQAGHERCVDDPRRA